jgi:hypothetical protein
VLEKKRGFTEAFGASGGYELSVQSAEHPFAQESRDASGEVDAQRGGGENEVQWTLHERYREPAEFDGEHHREDWADDERRNADAENGEETAQPVFPFPFVNRGEEAERDSDTHREAIGASAEEQRDGECLGDYFVNGVILLLQRGAEVAPEQVAEIN